MGPDPWGSKVENEGNNKKKKILKNYKQGLNLSGSKFYIKINSKLAFSRTIQELKCNVIVIGIGYPYDYVDQICKVPGSMRSKRLGSKF